MLRSHTRVLLISVMLLSMINYTLAADCYAWSFTKKAPYQELLPSVFFYDHVKWINLDPGKSC